MSEWLKEHAWKACVLQKGTAGSNPALSADKSNEPPLFAGFIIYKRARKACFSKVVKEIIKTCKVAFDFDNGINGIIGNNPALQNASIPQQKNDGHLIQNRG